MSSGVYYAQYDVLGDRDLGDHEQVRYVQGDVDQIFIQHGGRWHKVPRGGIVSGARAGMVLRSPLTHRAINVTLEFGRRLVDGFASRPAYLDDLDLVKYSIAPQNFKRRKRNGTTDDPTQGPYFIMLVAPPGEALLVKIRGDKDDFFRRMQRPVDVVPAGKEGNRALTFGDFTAPEVFFTLKENTNFSNSAVIKRNTDPQWPDDWFLVNQDTQYLVISFEKFNPLLADVRLLGRVDP